MCGTFILVTMLLAMAMPDFPTASSCCTCAHGNLRSRAAMGSKTSQGHDMRSC